METKGQQFKGGGECGLFLKGKKVDLAGGEGEGE